MKAGDLQHSLISLVVMLMGLSVSFLLGVDLTIYHALGVNLFFFGREVAQAEYRWIRHFGGGFRKNMPILKGLDLTLWDSHSLYWNFLIPSAVSVLFVFLVKIL